MKRKSNLARSKVGILFVLTIAVGMFLTPSMGYSTKAGFLSVKGTSIVNGFGQAVLLRGVNYQGYNYPRLDSSIAHSPEDYARFARLGFNVVRLPISWANIEPTPDGFNLLYLVNYLDHDVGWAKSNGLYIVLEMAQWKWAARFGGSGAPEWTVQQYSQNESGMKAAISDFWANSTLQSHLLEVRRKIAQHYANESTIAGYDVMNEPWAYWDDLQATQATRVASFYVKVTNSIRTVDKNHIILLEPAVFNTYALPINATNIVWAPHFYTLSFASTYTHDEEKILEADFLGKLRQFVVGMGDPMWIGEFGAFMKDDSSRAWLEDAVAIFNEYHVGWAWWAYYPSDTAPSQIPQQVYLTNP